jgi:hypothetical protein
VDRSCSWVSRDGAVLDHRGDTGIRWRICAGAESGAAGSADKTAAREESEEHEVSADARRRLRRECVRRAARVVPASASVDDPRRARRSSSADKARGRRSAGREATGCRELACCRMDAGSGGIGVGQGDERGRLRAGAALRTDWGDAVAARLSNARIGGASIYGLRCHDAYGKGSARSRRRSWTGFAVRCLRSARRSVRRQSDCSPLDSRAGRRERWTGVRTISSRRTTRVGSASGRPRGVLDTYARREKRRWRRVVRRRGLRSLGDGERRLRCGRERRELAGRTSLRATRLIGRVRMARLCPVA